MKHSKKSITVSQRDSQDPAQLRVLLAGHLPPPIGGVAAYYQSLLSSSLPERVNLKFVQTSTHNRDFSQSGRATISNLIEAVRDCGRFLRAVISYRPQLCHISTAFGLSFLKHGICVIIARVLGSRVLLHPHCSLSTLYSDRPEWWRYWFSQVIRLTDGVIALSSEWKLVSKIVPGSRVYLLQNAINLAPYQSIAQERLSHPLREDIRILYLGYIGKAKGSFDLLDTALRMSSQGVDTSFDLVGSEMRPGELDLLKQQIIAGNLSGVVRIHPPVLGAEKLNCFRNADIFVYPSYSEGMPMAVIEAMASGLPIVATNVGGLPDMVESGVNGFLVDTGCPDQMADALLKIITNPPLLQSMQKKSAQIAAKRFDIEQHVLKLVDIYAQSI